MGGRGSSSGKTTGGTGGTMAKGASKAGKTGGRIRINNPAGIPSNAITEEEFLYMRGVGDALSGAGIDRIGGANMTRMTERQRTKAKSEIAQQASQYYDERAKVRAEYKSLIESGKIRDKTPIEKTITKANGNPDNASVQAARRMAEKKGYDWKTGKKLKK